MDSVQYNDQVEYLTIIHLSLSSSSLGISCWFYICDYFVIFISLNPILWQICRIQSQTIEIHQSAEVCTQHLFSQSIYTPDFCYATTMIIVPFNFRNGIPKVHEIPGSIKCPVTAWEKFIEKRPKKYSNSDSAMFIRPVGTGNDPCNDHESGKFLKPDFDQIICGEFCDSCGSLSLFCLLLSFLLTGGISTRVMVE